MHGAADTIGAHRDEVSTYRKSRALALCLAVEHAHCRHKHAQYRTLNAGVSPRCCPRAGNAARRHATVISHPLPEHWHGCELGSVEPWSILRGKKCVITSPRNGTRAASCGFDPFDANTLMIGSCFARRGTMPSSTVLESNRSHNVRRSAKLAARALPSNETHTTTRGMRRVRACAHGASICGTGQVNQRAWQSPGLVSS